MDGGPTIYQQYTELLKSKLDLEAQLRLVNGRMREVEEQALEEMTRTGVGRINVDGVTLYPQRSVSVCWAVEKPGDRERAELMERLRDVGLGHLVKETVTLQALTAHFREAGEDEVPKELSPLVALTERYVLRYRQDG